MRVPLPPPGSLTLWRSRPQEVVGAFVRLTGSDGLVAYEMLVEDREAIDREFVDAGLPAPVWDRTDKARSEEHTSELQSLMRISYAVFCLNKKKKIRKI